MTGFGSAEKRGFRVEIRSLNHRFMDISVKLPPVLLRHEIALRDVLRQRFGRGKFDVYVSIAGDGREEEIKVNINKAAAKGLLTALNGLREELSIPGAVDIGTILNFKGLFMTEEVSYETAGLYEAFMEAVHGLELMRIKEGEALAVEIDSRAGNIEALNKEIIPLCPSVMESCKRKFLEKIKEFLPAGYDDARLLQEAAAAAEKADITEELTRIKNHLEYLRTILSEGGTIGRKLDFLLQELNREANTIASKADDYRVLNIVVEMKAEIEKTREQAQNIQ